MMKETSSNETVSLRNRIKGSEITEHTNPRWGQRPRNRTYELTIHLKTMKQSIRQSLYWK